jgi:tetratricopeptide (TPR) repeat protein
VVIAAAASSQKPHVDLQAMQEAIASAKEKPSPYPSAGSYAHYLASRLAYHQGASDKALSELKLAMGSNDQSAFLMTELGEQLARTGHMQKAEVALEKAVAAHPKYAPAQLMYGRVLSENDKTAKAQLHLRRAIALAPDNVEAYLVLCQLLVDVGAIDDAVSTMMKLADAVPGEPVGFRRLGLLLAEREDRTRAARMLRLALERDPADAEAGLALARILEHGQKNLEALSVLDNVIRHHGEDREVLLAAGRLALGRGDKLTARTHFDHALMNGFDGETAVRISMIYLATGHRTESAAMLDDARTRLDDARIHFYAGLVHERSRNIKAALTAFESAGTSSKGAGLRFDADVHRGECLSLLGQHPKAIELLRHLTEERPDSVVPVSALSRAFERAGKLKEAETVLLPLLVQGAGAEVYEAVSQFFLRHGRSGELVRLFSNAQNKDRKDNPLALALAVALERDGRWREAIDSVRNLTGHAESGSAAMNFIAYTLAEHNADLDEAERLANAALVRRPESAAFLDTLGWVQYRKKNYGKAIELLEKAVERAGDEVTLVEHLADVYAQSGNVTSAKAQYSRVLDVLKRFPAAAERKNQRAEVEQKSRALDRH